ncbi:MAG: tryptophan--tRNA ligase [Rhodanobacteraceae bacterium]
MSEQRRVLTGITTSGTPHLGNYVGAIRPAVAASHRADVESFYFLADYHALVKCDDPARVQRSTLEIAATWLACGLDPAKVFFYRQSDIPEIPELTWMLTCVTPKGLLNRAHAYKAAVDQNSGAGDDPDSGINAGLYMYPVLMAADILIFKAHEVPVGRDQVQHLEIARDIAQRFNHLYADSLAQAKTAFVLPEVRIEENVATLPGTDGRKMSKSYNNTIPLWLSSKDLKKAILGIVTDSRAPGEAKDAETSNIFAIYQAFASEAETADMRRAFADGIAWGEAKQKLFERIDAELAAPRARYEALISNPAELERQLVAGAAKARDRARGFMDQLRWAVGIRRLTDVASKTPEARDSASRADATALPQLKNYRESDGRFYFRLADAEGNTLLQSRGFDSPKEAGRLMAALVEAGDDTTNSSALVEDAFQPGTSVDLPVVLGALSALKADKLAREKAKS